MRRILFSTAALVALVAFTATAGVNPSHGGIRVGYVAPEDPLESTIGFGAEVGFGLTNVPNFTFCLEGNYWSKNYSEDVMGTTWDMTFSDISVGVSAAYEFSEVSPKIHPYIGAGAGLHMVKAETEVMGISVSATDNKFGGHAFGGVKVPVTPLVNFIAEARYALVDPDYLGIYGGLTYSFLK
jgi:opacity protein-like surface antigen